MDEILVLTGATDDTAVVENEGILWCSAALLLFLFFFSSFLSFYSFMQPELK